MKRRAFLTGALLVACRREERCKTCGMKIDPASTWRSDLVAENGATTSFDTPRCALAAWKRGKVTAKAMRVHEYYDASGPMRDASELRFVKGGDVVGPMGPDLVPVDPSRVSKFIQDHAADRALRLEEITERDLD